MSTLAILQRLNITDNFRFGALCPRDEHSCRTRCLHGAVSNVTQRQKNLPCYCDSLCLDVGDCCYDFAFKYAHVYNCRTRMEGDKEVKYIRFRFENRVKYLYISY